MPFWMKYRLTLLIKQCYFQNNQIWISLILISLMNKLDDLLVQLSGEARENAVASLLFDHYIMRYRNFLEKRFGLGTAAEAQKVSGNFFMLCLSSVTHESKGLFEAFPKFRIAVCWTERKFEAELPAIEEQLPRFINRKGYWLTRERTERLARWRGTGTTLELTRNLRTSALAPYVQMIDSLLEPFLRQLPPGCLFKPEMPSDERQWDLWRIRLTDMPVIQFSAVETYDLWNAERYTLPLLNSSREIMLEVMALFSK